MENKNLTEYLEDIKFKDKTKVFFPKNSNDLNEIQNRKRELTSKQNKIINELKLNDDERFGEKEPAHFKLYISDLLTINNIYSSKSKRFIDALIELKMISISGTFEITPKKKKKIMKHLNISYLSYFTDVFNELQKKIEIDGILKNQSLIIKLEKDEFDEGDIYALNPFFIASGPWHEIRERRIRIVVDYIDDKKIVNIQQFDKNNNEVKPHILDDFDFVDGGYTEIKKENSVFNSNNDFDVDINFN